MIAHFASRKAARYYVWLSSPRLAACIVCASTVTSINAGLICQCLFKSWKKAFYRRGGGLQPLNDLFILDCANLSWQWPELDESSAPLPRNAHIAADISGKSLLIHGGWNPFQETYNDTQILNIGDLSGVWAIFPQFEQIELWAIWWLLLCRGCVRFQGHTLGHVLKELRLLALCQGGLFISFVWWITCRI